MTFQTVVAPAVALALALSVPTQAKAEVSPTALVVASMAIARCATEYGHSHEMGGEIFAGGVDSLTPQIVRNIVDNPQFDTRVRKHIDVMGGCKSINDKLTKALTTNTTN